MKRLAKSMGGITLAAAMTLAGPLAVAAGAQAVHESGAETFIDEVPCVEGDFEITIDYRDTWHERDNGGNFNSTGTFTAVPVNVVEEELVWHEEHGHHHRKIIAWENDEEGDTYSGKYRAGGVFNGNRNAMTGTFNFKVNGQNSSGDRVQGHFTEHFTATDGGEVVRSAFEKERCG